MKKRSDDDSSHYEGALLEDIFDTVKTIAEGRATLWNRVDRIENLPRLDPNGPRRDAA